MRDLVLVNGRLWSGGLLAADAVRLGDGRIVAVGRAAELATPDADVRDAAGATVTPGLVDAHLHFTPWARARMQPDLHGQRSRAEALVVIARALIPGGTGTLVGRGWDESEWHEPPHRATLDALASERPVLLHRHDFHALWVNSAALRAAGITRHTPEPAGGTFERDASGELTGVVREHAVAAFAALEEAAGPALTPALLDAAAHALHAQGVTGVHDYQRNHDDWQRMHALAARHQLRVLQHIGSEQLQQARSLGLAALAGDDWFRTGSLKLFADGTLGSRTALMLERYDDTDTLGMALLSRDELVAAVGEAAAAGFSVTIHAIGDRAARHALDAIEAHHARLRTLPLPPRIEHVQLLDDADRPRFRALGVAASMQPQHAASDAAVARRAWGVRCDRSYPWATLAAAGVTLAFGSDAPVEPPCAALGLAAAVERMGADRLPFVPAQAVSLDVALAAYTSGAAALAAGRLGSGRLAVGEPGDVVVWDRDLHRVAGHELAAARPRWTALAGQIVYDSHLDPDAGSPAGTAAHAHGTPR
ncbi:MAG: amidohydrolase [Candidatus Eisenbacteria bacterium]